VTDREIEKALSTGADVDKKPNTFRAALAKCLSSTGVFCQ
jgi:hypothetical protein